MPRSVTRASIGIVMRGSRPPVALSGLVCPRSVSHCRVKARGTSLNDSSMDIGTILARASDAYPGDTQSFDLVLSPNTLTLRLIRI